MVVLKGKFILWFVYEVYIFFEILLWIIIVLVFKSIVWFFVFI